MLKEIFFASARERERERNREHFNSDAGEDYDVLIRIQARCLQIQF